MTGAALTAPPVEMHPVEVHIRVMLTPSRALDEWLDDLERRDFSAKTVRDYSRVVGKFVDSLPRDLDISKVTLDQHIRPHMRQWRHLAPGTKAAYEAPFCEWFKWLYKEAKITRSPVEHLARTRRMPSDELDVTSVSEDEVRLLLFHAETWAERLTINVLAYLGPRRHALAMLKVSDYDRARQRIRFREKGGKTIYKPIPADLDALIESAMAAGVYEHQDYLIPPEGPLSKKGDRDDRCIWRIVKKVAGRAGIEAHTHSLRAAFACFYLAENPGDIVGLGNLLGHKQLATTQIYLRKANKQAAMEPVRSLSWGVSSLGDVPSPDFPQIAGIRKGESLGVGAGGFEPPNDESSLAKRDSANEPGVIT